MYDWREAAEIYVDVVNCRNNSEAKCSCMAIYSHQHSHKPSLWWPKMICELCFTWKIDNLGKQKSTVVCLKCKQRSWWNNKTNDTQCLRSTEAPLVLFLARKARNKAEGFLPITFDGGAFYVFLHDLCSRRDFSVVFCQTSVLIKSTDRKLCHYWSFTSKRSAESARKFGQWKINGPRSKWGIFHAWLNFYQFEMTFRRPITFTSTQSQHHKSPALPFWTISSDIRFCIKALVILCG